MYMLVPVDPTAGPGAPEAMPDCPDWESLAFFVCRACLYLDARQFSDDLSYECLIQEPKYELVWRARRDGGVMHANKALSHGQEREGGERSGAKAAAKARIITWI